MMSTSRPQALSWMQLLRLPNIFTLLADILAALWVVDAFQTAPVWALAAAVCGSVSLYFSGMALNDVCDVSEDARLRPDRPLPSGEISVRTARNVGWVLWLAGVGTLGLAGLAVGNPCAFWPALAALAGGILLYDFCLKNTLAGPLLMGLCRGVNWLLFLSFAQPQTGAQFVLIPVVVTLYIAGVTFYSRCETEPGRKVANLVPGVGLMAAAFALLYRFDAFRVLVLYEQPWRWTILVVLLGLMICFRAISGFFVGPGRVRRVVKQAIFMLFFIDAAVVFATCGLTAAVWILALMLPATLLGRWVYST